MDKNKYQLPDYGEVEVDENTRKHLEKTKNETSDVKFDPETAKVRISILMEGDLLIALKEEARKRQEPYQTLMKEMLRHQLWKNHLGFEPQEEAFECVYEGFKPCLKLVK